MEVNFKFGKIQMGTLSNNRTVALIDFPSEKGYAVLSLLKKVVLPQGVCITECEKLPKLIIDESDRSYSTPYSSSTYSREGGGK
jgi:hypothetical protein